MSRVSVRNVVMSTIAVVAAAGVIAGADATASVAEEPQALNGKTVVVGVTPAVAPMPGQTRMAHRAASHGQKLRVDAARAKAREAAREAARRKAARERAARERAAREAAAARQRAAARAQRAAQRVALAGSPRDIAQAQLAQRGWSSQFSCLDALWTKESGWNPSASNPSSGAYGIPQALPASKIASAGADWQTNPATQIAWGLDYIAGSYGTPCGAWSHSESVGWY